MPHNDPPHHLPDDLPDHHLPDELIHTPHLKPRDQLMTLGGMDKEVNQSLIQLLDNTALTKISSWDETEGQHPCDDEVGPPIRMVIKTSTNKIKIIDRPE